MFYKAVIRQIQIQQPHDLGHVRLNLRLARIARQRLAAQWSFQPARQQRLVHQCSFFT